MVKKNLIFATESLESNWLFHWVSYKALDLLLVWGEMNLHWDYLWKKSGRNNDWEPACSSTEVKFVIVDDDLQCTNTQKSSTIETSTMFHKQKKKFVSGSAEVWRNAFSQSRGQCSKPTRAILQLKLHHLVKFTHVLDIRFFWKAFFSAVSCPNSTTNVFCTFLSQIYVAAGRREVVQKHSAQSTSSVPSHNLYQHQAQANWWLCNTQREKRTTSLHWSKSVNLSCLQSGPHQTLHFPIKASPLHPHSQANQPILTTLSTSSSHLLTRLGYSAIPE